MSIFTSTLFAQTHWETAVYAEDVWSYYVGINAPPDNWNELTFDTSNWEDGQGGFGYADGDDNTVISNTLSVFFRKSFNIVSLGEILSLAIHADYDDGFVAYLNGSEFARSNVSGNPPSHDQGTDGWIEMAIPYSVLFADGQVPSGGTTIGAFAVIGNKWGSEYSNQSLPSQDLEGSTVSEAESVMTFELLEME